MGHHYVRPDLLGLTAPVNGRVNGTGTYTGVTPPAILVYVPDGQGGLELAGIELLVFAAAWDAANNHPPMYNGRTFNFMADDPKRPHDEAHRFMPHYYVHIWLFEHNPSGLYAQWNPSISCGVGHFPTSATDGPNSSVTALAPCRTLGVGQRNISFGPH